MTKRARTFPIPRPAPPPAPRYRDGLMAFFLLLCAVSQGGIVLLGYERQTVLWYEALWLMSGLIGAGVVLWMMRDLVIDGDRLRADGLNGGDEMLNRTALGINGFLLAIEGAVILIGNVAILLPTTANVSSPTVTPIRVALTLSFFLIAAAADACALWMRVRRRKLRQYLFDNYRAEHITHLARGAAAHAQDAGRYVH